MAGTSTGCYILADTDVGSNGGFHITTITHVTSGGYFTGTGSNITSM